MKEKNLCSGEEERSENPSETAPKAMTAVQSLACASEVSLNQGGGRGTYVKENRRRCKGREREFVHKVRTSSCAQLLCRDINLQSIDRTQKFLLRFSRQLSSSPLSLRHDEG